MTPIDEAALKAEPLAVLRELLESEEAQYPAAEQGQAAQTAWVERKYAAREAARALVHRSQGQEPVARNNALRDDHPLSKGFCAHDVSMAKHCAACAKPPSRDTVVPAEQAEDSAMLDWLESKHFSLSAIKEPCGDDQFALWWQVTQGRKSISGHPLASPREAIRAAIGRNREAGGS